jgi:uncharacterized protein DUF6796
MRSDEANILRLTGIAGIAAAVAWTIGDALLLGARATAENYPVLAKYAGASGLTAQVVQAGIQFFPSSQPRLAAGALVAVLTTPLYLAATWHIYLALKPAGKWPSLGPLLLLGTGYVYAPFVHGSFYYVAEMIKLLPIVEESAHSAILEAATRATAVLFGTYFILALVTLAGFVWMIVTVASGRSRYPRWVAVTNPIVMMVIGSLLSRVLPSPFSIWLDGAGLNLGMLFFMILSTMVLWNERGAT